MSPLPPQPPSFEEWVHHCFTQGYPGANGTFANAEESVESRERRFYAITPALLTEYLTRLFEAPRPLAKRYSDDQISKATWFIFGCESGYIAQMRRGYAPPEAQARCVRAVTTWYTDLLDRVCGRRGTEPDIDIRDSSEVDGAVYMMWDMGHLEGTVIFPKDYPHLVEPSIGVLEGVLERCRTSACRVSALHGIGHIYCAHDYNGDKAIAARMQGIVDRFLERRDMRAWLRAYAEAARVGAVQ